MRATGFFSKRRLILLWNLFQGLRNGSVPGVKNLTYGGSPDNYGPSSPFRLSISRSVVRFNPRRAAARFLFPPLRERASRMRPFSKSSLALRKSSPPPRSFSAALPMALFSRGIIACGRSFLSNHPARERTTRRSTRFSSSLTFPGQGYRFRISIASGRNPWAFRPSARGYFPRKCSTSTGMSSTVPAAGGQDGNTLRRK